MSEFKCINCGAIRNSEYSCSCSMCGYRMFKMPYERSEILRKEIISFIIHLRLENVSYALLDIFRNVTDSESSDNREDEQVVFFKQDDDKRFPDYKTIQEYVCSSTKTEIFCERLNTSIEHIRGHLHEYYHQEYQISLDKLNAEIKEYDHVLKDAINDLGMQVELPEIDFPNEKLYYSETPKESVLADLDSILDSLLTLSDKIRKFIKQNNTYGTAYRLIPDTLLFIPEGNCCKDVIDRCRRLISDTLAKQFVLDIFSDGTEELGEMLQVIWTALRVVMVFPAKKCEYVLPNGEKVEDICEAIRERINARYSVLDDIVLAYDFLTDRSDEELFDIYDKLIRIDSYGIMGYNETILNKYSDSEKKLNELIGLTGIKESVRKIKAYALSNVDSDSLNLHMCFMGNPGSGKTEVARYIAGILYENKILPTKKIIEVDRSGLVSQYFGATAEKTNRVITSAMGGVLFIDEAYALGNGIEHGSADYGKEAIDTLVKAMEDYRGKFCVIFAGYKNEMLQMMSTNPGFRSRIQFTLDFPDYSRDELKRIAESMLIKRDYSIDDAAMVRILDITDIKRKEPNFANAREIRNILDQVIMCQNIRCLGSNDKNLGIIDVNKYIQDTRINLPIAGGDQSNKVLTDEEELDQLIGLSAVKHMIKKIKAYAKRNKGEDGFNLHMCFYGNPGTGKTEVARILSRILYDVGVLDEAKLVETDGQGLIGKYVGETAPKTEAIINKSMNGVLFIDEAYSLIYPDSIKGGPSGYGDEAVAVLLKAMEDHREQFCVILAGYKNEMQNLLKVNPGFESRIQFKLEFPDYTREELSEIARGFITKKKYAIDPDALEKVLDIADYYRNRPNFANARTVRTIIDQVLMNQNLRTEDQKENNTIAIADVEEYLIDEGIDINDKNDGKRSIGFI